MTKPTGIGRGGRRAGGRRPGVKNKKTVLAELLPKLEEADQELPLYGLLRRIADENLDPKYRDLLRIACLPFLHARLRSDMLVKPAYLMSDEELQQVRAAEMEHEKQLRKGRGHLHLIKGPAK
jgi:hypothetical protein